VKKIFAVGGTSKLAQEVLKCFARTGAEFFITGRDEEKLAAVSADLRIRGAAKVVTSRLDLNDVARHPQLYHEAVTCLGELDVMLVAHGTLPDQALCQRDVNLTLHELSTNFLSVVSLLTLFGNYFEENRRGCLAVISSVAGDRGRQSNYIYGSAKAAVTVFLQGLRNRLFKAGVTVITVKPGFVDTPMTARLPKNFLYADPAVVGQRIFKAIIKGQEVVYVPWFWRWIMMLVKFIPERFFKQMRL
jgi:decaprenylphospho-beta-D-erythro-pentofuranosid-2-ulose 2-reductase